MRKLNTTLTLVVTARDMAKMLRQRPPLGQAILTLATHTRTLKNIVKLGKVWATTVATKCQRQLTDDKQFLGKIKFKLVSSQANKIQKIFKQIKSLRYVLFSAFFRAHRQEKYFYILLRMGNSLRSSRGTRRVGDPFNRHMLRLKSSTTRTTSQIAATAIKQHFPIFGGALKNLSNQ